jgi:alpha-beta hydrolase superfamily lysophospholipase
MRKEKLAYRLLLLALALWFAPEELLWAQQNGQNLVTIRGKAQEVYFYPAGSGAAHDQPPKVLFVPGDFGLHGHAVSIAQTMAGWGYDVYALDTRQYLTSLRGSPDSRIQDVISDFRAIGSWITGGNKQPILLVGWSEGAGLSLLAASSPDNKQIFRGSALFGLTESNLLGWRWSDVFSYVTKKDPDEPKFQTSDYMAGHAPLPLVLLQSSGDEYVSVDAARRLFALAREPKRFVLIQARDHRFDGNTEEFYARLRESLEWIRTVSK